MADPKPSRLASPMLVVRDQDRQQLEPVLALVDDVDDVERAERLDDRDDHDHDVDRPHDREDDPEEGLAGVRAVDGRRLTERRVHALESGQVQHHHVADVPPAGRDQHGPDVEVRVAQPVDDIALARPPEDAVDEALRGVLELPDDPDDRQRQHDRDEEGALVEPRPAHLPVEQHRQEDADRCRDEDEHQQPQDVVPDRRPERLVRREQRLVVLEADEVLGLEPGVALPVRKGQADREDGREPDQGQAQEGRDPDHQAHHDLVAPRQERVAPPRPLKHIRPAGGGTGRGGWLGCHRRS